MGGQYLSPPLPAGVRPSLPRLLWAHLSVVSRADSQSAAVGRGRVGGRLFRDEMGCECLKESGVFWEFSLPAPECADRLTVTASSVASLGFGAPRRASGTRWSRLPDALIHGKT